MKVGEYVRTRWGCIAKFKGINEDFYEFDNIIMDESRAVREELFVDIVEKLSPNIIDLIEVGDYVNELRVEKNKYGELYTSYVYYGGDIGKQCEVYTTWLKDYKEDEIYSILTKEQFSQMEYRIGE